MRIEGGGRAEPYPKEGRGSQEGGEGTTRSPTPS